MLHKVWLSQNKGQKIWIRLKTAAKYTLRHTYFFLTHKEGKCIKRFYGKLIMNIGLTFNLLYYDATGTYRRGTGVSRDELHMQNRRNAFMHNSNKVF